MKTATKLGRILSCLALLNLAVPGGALVTFGVPLREKAEETLAQRAKSAKDLAQRKAKSASRLLTGKEERTLQGRAGENPYLAGQSKWDVVYKGVNLMTGNYSTSATDMSFDGGYGIPVNVTRSYSSNNMDEGPFGKGWTLSADVRSTAGGLLKSGPAPVRAVPVSFKERPSAEADPNSEAANGLIMQPVEAVTATDAGGDQETVQKDIDGVLTTPPWDTNFNENTQYEFVVQNGQTFQVMTHNETVTAEGTRYVYDKKGYFLNGGTKPWNDAAATPQPANVTKVISATDRQGNVTTYSYGTGTFDYVKSNGTTRENPLTGVTMPGGHVITFTWGNTGAATGRITSISDGAGGRTVGYTYSGTADHGLLASTTSAGGKTTTYGYASGPLTTINDPRGLTTTIGYGTADVYVAPYGGYLGAYTVVTSLIAPNGVVDTFIRGTGMSYMVTSKVGTRSLDRLTVQCSNDSGTFSVLKWRDIIASLANPSNYHIARRQSNYDVNTQNLTSGFITDGLAFGLQHSQIQVDSHQLASYRIFEPNRRVDFATTYNFLGAPLTQTTQESLESIDSETSSLNVTRTAIVGYSYWGQEKYFQQKAVRDQAGRFSYTDYYPRTAAAGKRGQTYRVYDSKNGGIFLDTNAVIPAYTPAVTSDKLWRYQISVPSSNYAAQFDYDAQGRPTDVWKLQKTTPSWSYVQTHTTFGSDGAPTWGQASQVVEDFGGIGRTTQTLAYTAWGKASKVRDAKGQEFETTFDNDGLVQNVKRTDVTPVKTIVSYVYGNTPGTVSYGQPTSIADGLSNVAQAVSYVSSGGGLGQPSSIVESGGSNGTYTTSYTYSAAGERETATYATTNGTTRWGYYDYVPVGDPANPSRPFETLCRLDASGNRTSEEFHYAYDSSGRVLEAAFAQTPTSSVRLANGGFYDTDTQDHLPMQRARAKYVYDSVGRLNSVAHYWDSRTFVNGSYVSTTTAVLGNTCTYELSGLNRGLKTASTFYKPSTTDPTQFVQERNETYGYDASLDYLTSANYGDGLANATPSWTYDAAGNRNDASVVDNLNRATTLGGTTVTNDILGNRLTKGGVTYGWDPLNRLTSLSGSTAATYAYRADGMRVGKTVGSVTTQYRYDGQMGIEDMEAQGLVQTVTRYGLGARGVDMIERTNSSGTTTVFPIYDAHGNNVASLSRNGTGWSVNDRRSYDAWGVVRAQQSAGDPKLRYCASLGHKQDDESGLIYMRARYCEPSTGRFISEDPARHRSNWFTYASNIPNNNVDPTGREDLSSFLASNGVLGELQGIGVGSLAGDIAVIEGHVMVEVTMFEGAAAEGGGALTTQVMNIIRQWAMGNGINAITIQGIAASREGQIALSLATAAIKAAGDGGKLQKSGVFTYIYWLLGE